MAFRIVWTERASADLLDIVSYIREFDPGAAARIGKGFYRQVGLLAEYPELGLVLKRPGEGRYRKILYRNWKIVYDARMDDNTLIILRLWHSSRGDVELRF